MRSGLLRPLPRAGVAETLTLRARGLPLPDDDDDDDAVEDNRALARASAKAQEDGLPLVVVFALNPGDYRAHDRAHRRIDFVLRNLAALKVRRRLGFARLPLPAR